MVEGEVKKWTFEARDEFKRKPIADKAITLLLSDVDVSPMVIDGQWGSGKTEFCHKLIDILEIENDHVKCVYVDAFKADHANNSLVTLISAVANLIDDPEKQNSFIAKAIPAVRYGLKALGKAGVSVLMKQNTDDIADGFEDAIKQASEDSVNVAVERIIKEHQESEENLDALKDALIEVASKNNLILFIDELDRCRPDFSVALLENIKHVFDVANVQFVLVANTEQLKSSINHCYGLGVEAQKYLDKFVKFTFRLSSFFEKQGDWSHSAVEHCVNLIGDHDTLSNSVLKYPLYQGLIARLINVDNRSLREAETFIRYLAIYDILSDNKGFQEERSHGPALYRVFSIYCFCFYPDLCEQICRGHIDGLQLAKILGVSSYKRYLDTIESERDEYGSLAYSFFLMSTEPVDGLDRSDSKELGLWDGVVRSKLSLLPSDGTNMVAVVIRTLQMVR